MLYACLRLGIPLLVVISACSIALLPAIVDEYHVDPELDGMLERSGSLSELFFKCTGNPLLAGTKAAASAKPREDACLKRGNDAKTHDGERYQFSRHRVPFADVNLPEHRINAVQKLTQQKEFIWFNVAVGKVWWLGAALLRFNYNNGVVIQLYNAETQESFYTQIELPLIAPFVGPYFEPDQDGKISMTAPGHCVRFDSLHMLLGTNISFCGSESNVGEVDVKVSTIFKKCFTPTRSGSTDAPRSCSVPFAAEFTFEAAQHEAMGLVFPIGPHRASQVTKLAAAPAAVRRFALQQKDLDGAVSVGEKPAKLPAVVGVDYTRGLLRRLTVWHWMSISSAVVSHPFLGPGRTFSYGLHVSTGTYDFKNASVESSIYGPLIGGFPGVDPTKAEKTFKPSVESHRLAFLDDPTVTFTQVNTNVKPHESIWKVTGVNLDLTFSPAGAPHFHGDFHYGILDGDLYHLWGTYSGRAPLASGAACEELEEWQCTVPLKDVPGVLEDHYALW